MVPPVLVPLVDDPVLPAVPVPELPEVPVVEALLPVVVPVPVAPPVDPPLVPLLAVPVEEAPPIVDCVEPPVELAPPSTKPMVIAPEQPAVTQASASTADTPQPVVADPPKPWGACPFSRTCPWTTRMIRRGRSCQRDRRSRRRRSSGCRRKRRDSQVPGSR